MSLLLLSCGQRPSPLKAAHRLTAGVLLSLLASCGPVDDQTSGKTTTFQTKLPETTEPTTAPAPVQRTDLQTLAYVAGVSEDDPEFTRDYARLQELCPPSQASIGDMVVSLQQMVKRESGRDLAMTNVMRQLATAQEGGQKAGMTCAETGGMLAELLIKGM